MKKKEYAKAKVLINDFFNLPEDENKRKNIPLGKLVLFQSPVAKSST